jgi:hypothetical protein
MMRNAICWMMLAFVPASLMAVDSGMALARPYGTTWLNGAAVQQSSAVFPGDLIQTNSGSSMKIQSSGSSVVVLANSLVKFEGGAVSVEHGSVKLATSKSMSAHAGVVTVAPASNTWTEFALTDLGGTVQIVALRGDLQISNGSETRVLAQGQQATQKDSDQPAGKPLAGAILGNSSFVLGAAGTSAMTAGRLLETTTTESMEVAHANVTKVISPVR